MNPPSSNPTDDPLSEITGLDPLSDSKTEPNFNSQMDLSAIMNSMQSGAPNQEENSAAPKSEPMATNQSEMPSIALPKSEPIKTESPMDIVTSSAEPPKAEFPKMEQMEAKMEPQ